ncbi:MAG: NYN domain-containing protein [Dehalococcoidia bacterium]
MTPDTTVPAEPVAAIDAAADASTSGPTRRPPRRRPASKQAETSEAAITAGADHATPASSATLASNEADQEPVAAPAPRPRTRRRRTTASSEKPADPALPHDPAGTETPHGEPTVTDPAQPVPLVEAEQAAPVSVEADATAEDTSPDIAAAPTDPPSPAPTSAWSPRRRYEIGPDGTVRFLDDRNRGAAAPNVGQTEPTAAGTPPSAAPAETDEAAAPPTRALYNRRREERRAEPDAPPPIAVEAAPESGTITAPEEVETVTDEAAGIDQGFIEGEESAEGGDQTPDRRRRRSRRGGRGRRRNGVTPDGIDAADALDLDLAGPADTALPEEIAPEPDEEAPRVMSPRERPERTAGGMSPLESLVARQNVILDQLLQRQERMARSMEQALKSVEARLRGTDLSHVSAMPRIAVFVDVPNIMYAAERYRVAVDFGKLLDYVAHDRTLIRASAYAPISDDPTQRLEAQRFVEPFVHHGYRIVTKPLKRFADGSIKANFDVELAMDILTMSDRLDIVSLVSGDGDFRRLVDIVASKGVRVEVVSFAQSTSAELKAVADTYIDLTQHLKDLCVPVEGDFKPRVPRPRIDISGYYE